MDVVRPAGHAVLAGDYDRASRGGDAVITRIAILIGVLVAAPLGEMGGAAAAGLVAVVWFGTEAALAKAAGWHVSPMSPVAWLVRDLMLPVVWLKGWIGDGFTWRGNDMTVAEPDVASPHGRA